MSDWKFEAIGTVWTISTPTEISKNIQQKVTSKIRVFDKNYSRFRSDSLVTQISKKPDNYKLPQDAKPMLDFYKKLYDITDGLVTPLIGKTIEQAGYDANYSFQPGKLTSPPSWNQSVDYNFPNITIKKPVLLDFGAAGKGYLVDIVGEILRTSSINNFVINAGGDILVHGKPQAVLLENPDDNSLILGSTVIQNAAFCGSGISKRNWGKYHHVIDPKKLISPTNIKSVWVQAESTMLADGLATALMFVDANKLRKYFGFEYAMIVGEDIKLSQNFNAEFFRT
ncbi:MAG: FAD:protein FMN transferase [Candidatus Saccharibacteria bacterium]|nr:FAD:protein FMN transferase [Candidatus Saccharibacteria bacterium]